MKLFKSLLVAPATLGLLAPMSATANEVTISDFTPAEQLAITNSRVDGLEARLNNFEAGGFSETTTMKGSAEFLIGAKEHGDAADGEEAFMSSYHFTFDLDTSFTGEDNLNIEISTGDQTGSKTVAKDLDFGEPAGSNLRVEDVNYTFCLLYTSPSPRDLKLSRMPSSA